MCENRFHSESVKITIRKFKASYNIWMKNEMNFNSRISASTCEYYTAKRFHSNERNPENLSLSFNHTQFLTLVAYTSTWHHHILCSSKKSALVQMTFKDVFAQT